MANYDMMSSRTWVGWVVVNFVVDGDTFDADLDLGHRTWIRSTDDDPLRFRVLEVNTPEKRYDKIGWAEGKAWLTELLPPGTILREESIGFDSFGRVLCHMWFPDGTSLASLYPEKWRVT